MKIGGGTLTLTVQPTYTGDTTVNEGSLTVVGAIDTPASDVFVATGATLNAASIVADTLTIGGAPHATANAAAVPEPGTFVLLALAGMAALLAALRRK
jgi:autotransporter-associated beta strand protein